MKQILCLTMFLLIAAQIPAQTAPSETRPLIFKNVTVIDVSGGKTEPGTTVIVAGDRITNVGKKVKIPKDAQIVDASGKFLIPGLWDMHAHTLTDNRDEWIFSMLIAHGITGVRELGNNLPFEQIDLIRRAILEGRHLGPRFGAATARILDGPGTSIPNVSTVVTTPDDARRLVREYKQNGLDFIKPYNLLAREVYLALVDEAKRQKIPIAGHVPFSMTAAEVSDLGQISLEHVQIGIFIACSRDEAELRREWQELIKSGQRGAGLTIMAKAVATYDEQKAQSFFALLRRNGTWICPTGVVFRPVELSGDESNLSSDSRMKYIPAPARRRWREAFQERSGAVASAAEKKARSDLRLKIIGAMHRAGIRLLAGSDTPNPYTFPGFSLHEELALLVEAGLTPLAALQTATINPARFLDKEKELGTIEKGKFADLVLLDANPLEDIRNTTRIAAVVLNGRYLAKTDLQKILSKTETANSPNTEPDKSVLFDFGNAPGFGLLSEAAHVCD